MIIYELMCDEGHEFEGWFSDSKDFDNQKETGLLTCPMCGCVEVTKQLSGTPLLKSRKDRKKQPLPKPEELAPAVMDDGVTHMQETRRVALDPVALLKAIETHVKTNYKNVGHDFTDRALEMEKGDMPKENIYGEVTTDQLQTLEDNDIDFVMLPKLGPEFEN